MNNIYEFQKIGDRIRTERAKLNSLSNSGKEKPMTQSDLANELGVTRQTVAKWERGDDMPSLSKCLELCNLFNCELGYLLCEYNCKTRMATDINRVTGLKEEAIEFLKQRKPLFECSAINEIITYDGGIIISIIYDYLFHKTNDIEIEVGNNVIINGDNIADAFLLQIVSELRSLRKKINGGQNNGKH